MNKIYDMFSKFKGLREWWLPEKCSMISFILDIMGLKLYGEVLTSKKLMKQMAGKSYLSISMCCRKSVLLTLSKSDVMSW